ncbi:hypothetical protein [Geodermatophilus obscurus]|nr:hypothetical protein [Geodermatophilus obscurus]
MIDRHGDEASSGCNVLVGHADNNADLLALAAEYVRQWKCC